MANLILASKRVVKSGEEMWHVYRSEDGQKSGEFYLSTAQKALKYAFLLRKRTGAVIPKPIYNKLMADVKAAQQEQPAQEAGDAPAAGELSAEAEAVNTHRALVKQYNEMREKHPDCILLFRNGDFYTAMDEDAEVVAEVCGLVVTRVDEIFHYNKPVVYTAFPAHALDTYLPKLVRAGKRVAICDQLTAPKK